MRNGRNEIVGCNGEVLYACAFEVVQVLLDLRFPLSWRRLVDRELYCTARVVDNLRPKRRVFCADVLVVEADQLAESEDVSVEFNPELHLTLINICDDVVDFSQPYRVRLAFDGNKAWREYASVLVTFDERMDGVAVGRDRRTLQHAMIILQHHRIAYSIGPPLYRLLVGPV